METILMIIIGVLLVFMGLNVKGEFIGRLAFPMIIGGIASFVVAYFI